MTTRSITENIPKPIEIVWDLVGDFSGISRWHPVILSCESDGNSPGCRRTVVFPDRTAVECLDVLDHAAHRQVYRVVQHSVPDLIGFEAEMLLQSLGPSETSLTWSWSIPGDTPGPVSRIPNMGDARGDYYRIRVDHLRHVLDGKPPA